MSLLAMSWALGIEVPATQKLILVVLADHSSTEGECFPSIKSVASKVGISDRSVVRHLSSLEKKGLIKRSTRTRPDGSQTSNSYSLLGVTPVSGGGGHPCPPIESCNNGTSVTNVTEIPSSDVDDGFETFKTLYPKRTGAQGWARARDRWRKLSTKDQELAVKGATAYSTHLKDTDRHGTSFVQMASTFLSSNGVWAEWADRFTKTNNTTTNDGGYISLPKEPTDE